MNASPLTLKRLIRRRLLRKGIDADVEGGEVFFCEPVKTVVPTRYGFNFFITYHRRLRPFTNRDKVSDVLHNKVNRFEKNWAWKMFLKKRDKENSELIYRRDQAMGELEEMVKHVQKVHVGMKR